MVSVYTNEQVINKAYEHLKYLQDINFNENNSSDMTISTNSSTARNSQNCKAQLIEKSKMIIPNDATVLNFFMLMITNKIIKLLDAGKISRDSKDIFNIESAFHWLQSTEMKYEEELASKRTTNPLLFPKQDFFKKYTFILFNFFMDNKYISIANQVDLNPYTINYFYQALIKINIAEYPLLSYYYRLEGIAREFYFSYCQSRYMVTNNIRLLKSTVYILDILNIYPLIKPYISDDVKKLIVTCKQFIPTIRYSESTSNN